MPPPPLYKSGFFQVAIPEGGSELRVCIHRNEAELSWVRGVRKGSETRFMGGDAEGNPIANSVC